MFNNQYYITSGINATISPALQILLWSLVEGKEDYLQACHARIFARESRQASFVQAHIHEPLSALKSVFCHSFCDVFGTAYLRDVQRMYHLRMSSA